MEVVKQNNPVTPGSKSSPKAGKDVVCPVCGGICRPSGIRGLLRCDACGFFVAPPQAGERAGLFGVDYFHGDGYADYAAERSALEANFKEYLKRILRRFSHGAADKTLFEAGCGFGYFLDLSRGFFKSVSGCEVSRFAAAKARGDFQLDIAEEDVATISLPVRPDIVCMWDVLPCLPEPDKALRNLADQMSKGAMLAVSMPNIGSLFARMTGRFWPQIQLPWRVCYFDPATITRLMAKSGFAVDCIARFHKRRSMREILYQVVARGLRRPDWFRALENLPFMDVRIPFGIRDEMFVMARRL